MHENAHDKSADGAAGQMQRGALLHAQVLDEPPLGEKIGGQLHAAAEAGADHGSAHAAVQAAEALGAVDLAHAVEGVAVVVLGADGAEGAEALQARLDEEEGRAGGGADDARRGAAEHVDAEVLALRVAQQQRGQAGAHGLVEAQAAAVEQDLVDVGAADAAVEAAHALVAHNDGYAVEGAAVVVRLVALGLQLALQLHADLDRLEGVRGRHGTARRDAARYEGAVGATLACCCDCRLRAGEGVVLPHAWLLISGAPGPGRDADTDTAENTARVASRTRVRARL